MQAETKRSATASQGDREVSLILNSLLAMHAFDRAPIWVGSHCTYNNTVRRSTRWISASKTATKPICFGFEFRTVILCS